MNQLPTNWNLLSVAFQSASVADVINLVINGADGKKTGPFATWFTFSFPKAARRVNWELKRRGINYKMSGMFCSGATMLLSVLLVIPVFVAYHQLAVALNLLSQDYNERG